MTKKMLLISLVLLGGLISAVCFLGYFEVIRNGVILSTLIKVLLLCALAIAWILFCSFRNFDKLSVIAIVVALVCAFIVVVK